MDWQNQRCSVADRRSQRRSFSRSSCPVRPTSWRNSPRMPPLCRATTAMLCSRRATSSTSLAHETTWHCQCRLPGLFKSSDIIWAFPEEEDGTFFTPNPNLSLAIVGLDIPKMTQRGWQLGFGRPNEFMWIVRQANNWSVHSAGGVNRLNDEWDMIKECLGGHNLNTSIISEKYYATRPDFFPLINGEAAAVGKPYRARGLLHQSRHDRRLQQGLMPRSNAIRPRPSA